MNTRLHITEHGTVFTVRIVGTAMGQQISATLSGPVLYALVDGLLWWQVNQMMDKLVACAQRQPAPTERDAALAFGHSLHEGEELVMHCFRTPYYEHDEERNMRILNYLNRHLPALQPIAQHGPHAAMATADLAELMELCTLLKDRMQHVTVAMHGLDGLVQLTNAA